VRPEIKAHRPPQEYIDLLTKDESEFRNYIREVESDPAFEKLLKEGWIRKINFRGRIPHHLYQEFQDRELMKFLEEYNITSRADWESDFFHKDSRSKVKELSIKYKVPRGELIKALEYCRHLKLSWEGQEDELSNDYFSGDEPDRLLPSEVPQISEQSDESISVLSEMMEEYSISEADFVKYFLSGNSDSFDIARELDIEVNAVEDILEALEKVQLMSAMQVNVVERRDASQGNETETIAVVERFKNPPRAEIQIDADKQYGFRYYVKDPEEEVSKEESLLIERLRLINQRRSLVFRMISFVYEFQYPYFVSGNELHLKPLSQARISKEVGEHESTISRILKNKYLETPEGNLPLKFFCQGKDDVIRRIIQIREKEEMDSGSRSKPFSDEEIAEIMERDYDIKISRRTVTYYRNKLAKAPKFYVRKREAVNAHDPEQNIR
jgi:hypothetical protein